MNRIGMKTGVIAGLCVLAVVVGLVSAALFGVWPFKPGGIPPVVNADGTTTYTIVSRQYVKGRGSVREYWSLRFPSTTWIGLPDGKSISFNGSPQSFTWPSNSYVQLYLEFPSLAPVSKSEYEENYNRRGLTNYVHVTLLGDDGGTYWEKYYKDLIENKCESAGKILPKLIEYKNISHEKPNDGGDFGSCALLIGTENHRFAAVSNDGKYIADTMCYDEKTNCFSKARILSHKAYIFFSRVNLSEWWSIYGKLQNLLQESTIEVRLEDID